MQGAVKRMFGLTSGKIDQYFALKRGQRLASGNRPTTIKLHPEVGDALDYQTSVELNDPDFPYYSGITEIERYYKSGMYNDLEARFPASSTRRRSITTSGQRGGQGSQSLLDSTRS
jgi:hypothetical protein